jgi:Ca2+-binding RTX toxin-like protein
MSTFNTGYLNTGNFYGANPTIRVIFSQTLRTGVTLGDGADFVDAAGGRAGIHPGLDDDYVNIGGGKDTIYTGHGSDIIVAGTGNDNIYAAAEFNWVPQIHNPADALNGDTWGFYDDNAFNGGASTSLCCS